MRRYPLIQKIISINIIAVFLCTSIQWPVFAQMQPIALPPVGNMLTLTQPYVPVMVKGIKVEPSNPFALDFIVDPGDSGMVGDALTEESTKLIKYFLASLTVPESDLWVNLSPYENDRIIPEKFGMTEMGRELLAQDYILKQMAASLMYPEDGGVGEEFWERVRETSGLAEIPVNTFNKVWIVPKLATVHEGDGVAYIGETHLKVMLEEDYLAMREQHVADNSVQSSVFSVPSENTEHRTPNTDLLKETILPALEEEVNNGQHFAPLRQIYHSLILASWYKRKLKNSVLMQVYGDQNKTKGVTHDDEQAAQKIYDQYVESFKTGVYNYIKEDYDPVKQEIVERKYFSGGLGFSSESMNASLLMKSTRELTRAQIATDSASLISVSLFDVDDVAAGSINEQMKVGEQSAETDASELGGEPEWPELAYHLPLLDSEDSRERRQALDAIYYGLSTPEQYSREKAVVKLKRVFTETTDKQFKEKVLRVLIAFAIQKDRDLQEEVRGWLASTDMITKMRALKALTSWLSPHQEELATFIYYEFEGLVAPLLAETNELTQAVVTFYYKSKLISGDIKEDVLEKLNTDSFKNRAKKVYEEIPEDAKSSFGFEIVRLNVVLGEDELVSPISEREKSKMLGLLPEGQGPSSQELTEFEEYIQNRGLHAPEGIFEELYKEKNKKIVFFHNILSFSQNNSDAISHMVRLLRKIIEDNGVKAVALPFFEDQVKPLLDGQLSSSEWGYRIDGLNLRLADISVPKQERHQEAEGFKTMINTLLSIGVDLIYYGSQGSTGYQGEIDLNIRSNKILDYHKSNEVNRVLVLADIFDSSKKRIWEESSRQYIAEKIIEDTKEEVVGAALGMQQKEVRMFDVKLIPIIELLTKYESRYRRGFGIPTQETFIGEMAYEDGDVTYAEGWDGLIIFPDKFDGGDDGGGYRMGDPVPGGGRAKAVPSTLVGVDAAVLNDSADTDAVVLGSRELYEERIEPLINVRWNNLSENTRWIIENFDIQDLEQIAKSSGTNAGYLFEYGLPTVKDLFTPEEFKLYWSGLVEMAKASGTNAGNLFQYGLPTVKDLFTPEEFKLYWSGLVEMAKASGENAWNLFENGLPAVKDLFTPKEFELYWSGLVEMAKASGMRARYLFQYGLPIVKDLFTPKEFKLYWSGLVEMAKASGENAWNLFENGLPTVKDLFTPKEFELYWSGLVEMAKASGTRARYLFENGLPTVKDLFTPEEFELYWNDLVEMAKASGENARYLFENGLPAVKDLFTPEEFELHWSGLVEMAKASGTRARYLFQYGLPAVKDLFTPEEFELYWNDLVENGYGRNVKLFALWSLWSNFDEFKIVYKVFKSIEDVNYDDYVDGLDSLPAQGRTERYKNNVTGEIIHVKIDAGDKEEFELYQEAILLKGIELGVFGKNLSADIKSTLPKVKGFTYAPGGKIALIYSAPEEYFHYITKKLPTEYHSRSVRADKLQTTLSSAWSVTSKLWVDGIFRQEALFHRSTPFEWLEYQQQGSVGSMNMKQLLEQFKYPNIGLTGARDFGHYRKGFRGLKRKDILKLVGDYLYYHIFLSAGAYHINQLQIVDFENYMNFQFGKYGELYPGFGQSMYETVKGIGFMDMVLTFGKGDWGTRGIVQEKEFWDYVAKVSNVIVDELQESWDGMDDFAAMTEQGTGAFELPTDAAVLEEGGRWSVVDSQGVETNAAEMGGVGESKKQHKVSPKFFSKDRLASLNEGYKDEENEEDQNDLYSGSEVLDLLELEYGFMDENQDAYQLVRKRMQKIFPEFEEGELPNIYVLNTFGEGINAFATIDGSIVITPELIDFIEYEEELDAILLHEYNHLVEKHLEVIQSSQLGGKLTESLGVKRFAEYDADARAFFQMMESKRSTNPIGMLNFLERLNQVEVSEKDKNNWDIAHGWMQDRIINIKIILRTFEAVNLEEDLTLIDEQIKAGLSNFTKRNTVSTLLRNDVSIEGENIYELMKGFVGAIENKNNTYKEALFVYVYKYVELQMKETLNGNKDDGIGIHQNLLTMAYNVWAKGLAQEYPQLNQGQLNYLQIILLEKRGLSILEGDTEFLETIDVLKNLKHSFVSNDMDGDASALDIAVRKFDATRFDKKRLAFQNNSAQMFVVKTDEDKSEWDRRFNVLNNEFSQWNYEEGFDDLKETLVNNFKALLEQNRISVPVYEDSDLEPWHYHLFHEPHKMAHLVNLLQYLNSNETQGSQILDNIEINYDKYWDVLIGEIDFRPNYLWGGEGFTDQSKVLNSMHSIQSFDSPEFSDFVRMLRSFLESSLDQRQQLIIQIQNLIHAKQRAVTWDLMRNYKYAAFIQGYRGLSRQIYEGDSFDIDELSYFAINRKASEDYLGKKDGQILSVRIPIENIVSYTIDWGSSDWELDIYYDVMIVQEGVYEGMVINENALSASESLGLDQLNLSEVEQDIVDVLSNDVQQEASQAQEDAFKALRNQVRSPDRMHKILSYVLMYRTGEVPQITFDDEDIDLDSVGSIEFQSDIGAYKFGFVENDHVKWFTVSSFDRGRGLGPVLYAWWATEPQVRSLYAGRKMKGDEVRYAQMRALAKTNFFDIDFPHIPDPSERSEMNEYNGVFPDWEVDAAGLAGMELSQLEQEIVNVLVDDLRQIASQKQEEAFIKLRDQVRNPDRIHAILSLVLMRRIGEVPAVDFINLEEGYESGDFIFKNNIGMYNFSVNRHGPIVWEDVLNFEEKGHGLGPVLYAWWATEPMVRKIFAGKTMSGVRASYEQVRALAKTNFFDIDFPHIPDPSERSEVNEYRGVFPDWEVDAAELFGRDQGLGIREQERIESSNQQRASSNQVGGIDLNPANWELQTRGQEGSDCSEGALDDCLKFDIPPAEIEQLRLNIDGLVPVIINVQPLPNVPLFLGLSDEFPPDENPYRTADARVGELSYGIKE